MRRELTTSRIQHQQAAAAAAKDEPSAIIIPRLGPLSDPPYIVSPLEVVRTNPCFQPQAQEEEQQASSSVATTRARGGGEEQEQDTELALGLAGSYDSDSVSKSRSEIAIEVASTNDEENSTAGKRDVDLSVEDVTGVTRGDPPSSCRSVSSPEAGAAPLDEREKFSDSIRHNNNSKGVKSAAAADHSDRLTRHRYDGDNGFERHLLPQETSLSNFTDYDTTSETSWTAGSVTTMPLGQVREIEDENGLATSRLVDTKEMAMDAARWSSSSGYHPCSSSSTKHWFDMQSPPKKKALKSFLQRWNRWPIAREQGSSLHMFHMLISSERGNCLATFNELSRTTGRLDGRLPIDSLYTFLCKMIQGREDCELQDLSRLLVVGIQQSEKTWKLQALSFADLDQEVSRYIEEVSLLLQIRKGYGRHLQRLMEDTEKTKSLGGPNRRNDNAYHNEKNIDTLANEYASYIDKVKEKEARISAILEAIILEEEEEEEEEEEKVNDEASAKALLLNASVMGRLSALDMANLRWATTILYTYGHVLYRTLSPSQAFREVAETLHREQTYQALPDSLSLSGISATEASDSEWMSSVLLKSRVFYSWWPLIGATSPSLPETTDINNVSIQNEHVKILRFRKSRLRRLLHSWSTLTREKIEYIRKVGEAARILRVRNLLWQAWLTWLSRWEQKHSEYELAEKLTVKNDARVITNAFCQWRLEFSQNQLLGERLVAFEDYTLGRTIEKWAMSVRQRRKLCDVANKYVERLLSQKTRSRFRQWRKLLKRRQTNRGLRALHGWRAFVRGSTTGATGNRIALDADRQQNYRAAGSASSLKKKREDEKQSAVSTENVDRIKEPLWKKAARHIQSAQRRVGDGLVAGLSVFVLMRLLGPRKTA